MKIKIIVLLFYMLPQILLAEQSYKNKTITYAAPVSWLPLIFPSNGSACGSGLFIEILNEIFNNRLEMNVQCSYLPWKRAQLEVKKGRADFMLTVPTKNRLKYTISSKHPVFRLYLHVYTYKDHPRLNEIKKITSAADIKKLNLIPVSNLGNGWHKENIDSFGVDTHYVSEDELIVQVLARKRDDIMIDAVIPMNHYIKKNKLTHKIVLTNVRFGPLDFYLLIGKQSKYKYLMPQVNKVINQLLYDGTIESLTKRYMKL